jgi:glutathione S-transferase
MVAEYKLVYFNFRGRGEVDRLVFAAAGQKFEDHRFDPSVWKSEYKAKSPLGAVPWLEIHENGKVTYLAQSITIGRIIFFNKTN